MAIREERDFLSDNERQFLSSCLRDAPHVRADGRELMQQRKIRVQFRRNERQSQAEVQLGRTRVIGNVHGEVVPPFPDRPTEGFLQFNVELSPMASQHFEPGRPSPSAVELARIVERGIRECRALDTEALAVVAGEKVWAITCDVHVVDHGGNLVDCVSLAAIAALMHFRRPEVAVGGGSTTTGGGGGSASANATATASVYSVDEHAAVPLSLHHIPISISFCFVEPAAAGGEPVFFMDPTDREERVTDGRLTFTFNSFRELCAVHKLGGAAVAPQDVLRCAAAAAARVQELTELLQAEAAKADEAAVRRRRALLRGRDFADVSDVQAPAAGAPRAEVDLGPMTDFDALHAPIALRDDPSREETDARVSSMAQLLESLESAADMAAQEPAATTATTTTTTTAAQAGLELSAEARDAFQTLAASLGGGKAAKEARGDRPRAGEKKEKEEEKDSDSDSDSEEEGGVVQSEFKAAKADVAPVGGGRAKGRKGKAPAASSDESEDEDMDLSAAVKRKA